jgi:hypothetical protein
MAPSARVAAGRALVALAAALALAAAPAAAQAYGYRPNYGSSYLGGGGCVRLAARGRRDGAGR